MHSLISSLKCSYIFKKITLVFLCVLLFLYSFSIPSFGSREKWNYIVYFVMALLAICVAFFLFLYKKPSFNKWFLPIPFFAIFSLIGTFLYSHQYRSFLTLLLLAISFYVLYYCFYIINHRRIVLSILVTALFAFDCYYIFHYRDKLLNFNELINGNVRLGTYFDNQNAVSAFSVITYLFSLYSLLFFKKKYRWLFVLPILSTLVVGISTGSRTFIVALIVITLVVTFFKYKKHPVIYFLFLFLFVGIIIGLFSMPFMATLRDRFIRIIWTFFTDSSRVDTSTLQRTVWLDYGFFLGNKHLFTGLGVGGFGVISNVGSYTHSNFSEVWCDFGLPGFILFYLPFVICLFFSFRNKSKDKSLIISVIIYYLLVSFSNVFYYTKFYYFILAFIYYLSFEGRNDKSYVKINNLKQYVKKIVITCEGMESGGAEKVISLISNELSNRSYEITVIGVSTHNMVSFYPLNNNVKYVTLHNGEEKRIKPFKRILLLRKKLKLLKPDIILSFLPHVNVYTSYATIGLKIPVIVSERNNPKIDPKGFLLRRLKMMSFNQADGVVFQTKGAMYCYRKSIRDKSTIIYNPVEERLCNIKPATNKNEVILSVGRLTKQKNFKLLIDAFSLFFKDHPNYCLKIYGNGELHDELINYAESKNISSKFEILEADSSWLEKEKDATLFVSSSDYEGMPNALLEAMVIGIPVVATDCPSGGPRELITNGVNGYLADVGNSQDLYLKMEMAIKNPLQYDTTTFSSKFTVNKITTDWLDYIKVVKEGFISQ